MRWIQRWFRPSRLDREIDRELQAHLDLHTRELIGRGMPREQALRQARLALGGVDQIAEQVRDARAGGWLDRLIHDGRDGLRGLRRTPGVTLTAIALVALVIGGNTTIYSMVHAVLTKPSPGVTGERLVSLEQRIDGRPAYPEHNYADYLDYVAQTTTLRGLLASQFQRIVLIVGDESYTVNGALVSSNYFGTLGVGLTRGRTFTPIDDTSSNLVAVVSDRVWQTYFKGADDVIGRTIVTNGHTAVVVGVAPPPFRGAQIGERADVWIPLLAYHRLHGTAATLIERSEGGGRTLAIGQLRPGATMSQARGEFATISARLQNAYPATNRRKSVGVLPYSMMSGGDSLVATQGPRFLQIFSIVTGLTLAIVCANVANLMLGRAVLRQRELALRQTLGASRARIIRTLLMEGFVIAVAAWVMACVLALAVSKGVVHLVPPTDNGAVLLLDLTPDWQVIMYAFALAILGSVVFTVAPAIRAWKQELLPSLRSGELGIVAGRSALSSALVVLQLAFAVLLLTSGGLAYRSLSMLASMPAGFDKEHLFLAGIETTEAAPTREAGLTLVETIRDRLSGATGIESVSYAVNSGSNSVQADGSRAPLIVSTLSIGPSYFATLGMAAAAGREFGPREPRRATPAVVITERLSQLLWPGGSPVGRTLRIGVHHQEAEVIGVVPNGVFSRFQREPQAPYVFRSLNAEGNPSQYQTFYVRYSGTLEAAVAVVRRTIGEIDRRVPLANVRTMAGELDDFTSLVRIITIWITLFAGGSLVIAAIGQYAVVAFDMRRRTRDFGVRIALGASPRQIANSVIGEGFRWTAVGLVGGFVLSLIAGRAFRALLVGVTPTDLPTYIGVFAVLTGASALACYLPARRAGRIDPIQALRQE